MLGSSDVLRLVGAFVGLTPGQFRALSLVSKHFFESFSCPLGRQLLTTRVSMSERGGSEQLVQCLAAGHVCVSMADVFEAAPRLLAAVIATVTTLGTHLQSLEISHSAVGYREIQSLRHLVHLRRLGLPFARNLNDPCLELLPSVVPGLTHLDIQGCYQVTDDGLGFLAGLRHLRGLRLDRNNHITTAGLAHLGNLPRLERLETGLVSGPPGHDLTFLAALHSLRHLSLNLFLPHLLLLRTVRHLPPSLEGLDISRWYVRDELMHSLPPLPRLQQLKLAYCNVWTVTPGAFGSINKLGALFHLDLRGCQSLLGRTLAHGLRTVSSLNLTGCTRLGSGSLDFLADCPQLTALYLGQSGVGDEHCVLLARLLSLRVLDLSGCTKITDRGVDQLARGCPLLTQLLLRGTAVTDGCGRALAKCPALAKLDLGSCRLTHFCAVQLAALAPLQCLGVQNCPDSFVRAVKRELPHVHLF